MNDADVSKQIHQMVRFIQQEAEEKATEISLSAEEVPPFLRSLYFLDRYHIFNLLFISTLLSFFLHVGIQYREASIGRSREEEDQARI
jgi:hypothetical protein